MPSTRQRAPARPHLAKWGAMRSPELRIWSSRTGRPKRRNRAALVEPGAKRRGHDQVAACRGGRARRASRPHRAARRVRRPAPRSVDEKPVVSIAKIGQRGAGGAGRSACGRHAPTALIASARGARARYARGAWPRGARANSRRGPGAVERTVCPRGPRRHLHARRRHPTELGPRDGRRGAPPSMPARTGVSARSHGPRSGPACGAPQGSARPPGRDGPAPGPPARHSPSTVCRRWRAPRRRRPRRSSRRRSRDAHVRPVLRLHRHLRDRRPPFLAGTLMVRNVPHRRAGGQPHRRHLPLRPAARSRGAIARASSWRLAVLASLTGYTAILYWGINSAAPCIVVLGIYFFSRSQSVAAAPHLLSVRRAAGDHGGTHPVRRGARSRHVHGSRCSDLCPPGHPGPPPVHLLHRAHAGPVHPHRDAERDRQPAAGAPPGRAARGDVPGGAPGPGPRAAARRARPPHRPRARRLQARRGDRARRDGRGLRGAQRRAASAPRSSSSTRT